MVDPIKQNSLPIDQRALTIARRPVGLMGKVGRLSQVLRHYDSVQIFRRGCNLLAKKLQPGKMVGKISSDNGKLTVNSLAGSVATCIVEALSDHPSHKQCDLSTGMFTMLCDAVSMPNGFDPTVLNQQSHLWRFQFHYHEFLLTQAAIGNWQAINSFLTDWLTQYSPEKVKCSDDAWHPYCTSRRIVAWIWLMHHSNKEANGLSVELMEQMLNSLIQQANYLSKNLERDLGGNHLLENATALAIASGTIDSKYATRWREIATSVLAVELPKQVLLHGEHFEFSPMYHCQILSNVLRIEACCHKDQTLLDILTPIIRPMLKFLFFICHPDGEIPLFADSGFHEAPSVQEIVAISKVIGYSIPSTISATVFESLGGYRIFRSEKLFGICDFGPIAASTLPAHGHCDATNLEVSVEGSRWIVDSGNFNYADDSMRHYCRSSIAHNVVTINDQNQANVWSKFRMGDRAKVSGHQQGVRGQWHWATVAHNGYQNLGVPKISRLVAFQDQAVFCIDQAVSSGDDALSLVGYLHLHPDVWIRRDSDSDGVVRFRLGLGSTERTLLVFADEVFTEPGWYCTGFGQREIGVVIRYTRSSSNPNLGWMLHDFENDPQIRCSSASIQIIIGDLNVSWTELSE